MRIKKFLLSLNLIFLTQHVFAAKLDHYVQQQLVSQHKVNGIVFIVLKEQANLSGAVAFSSREEKGRFIYDALRNKALTTQAPLVEFLTAKRVKFRQFYIENMIAVEDATEELLTALSARSDVAKIKGNPLTKLKLPKTKRLGQARIKTSGPEKNIIRIGAIKVWQEFGVRGEDIVVAGQDTGVQWNHPALINQYRGRLNDKVDHNYNWHDAIHAHASTAKSKSICKDDSPIPCDDYGHGTHTMGTIVGDDNMGNQIGVAPKAKWIACRNMKDGVGSVESYTECFEFFLAPYPLHGNPLKDGDPSKAPHIINNSWGCSRDEGCTGNEILASLEVMKKAGIFVVASAGNDGPNCATIDAPPAWHTGLTLSVGAFDHRNDKIASFSSRGPSSANGGIGPNLTAPGVTIRSSVPGGGYESMFWSGTSMAGPHAVGAVALLWSYHKDLIGKIDETMAIMQKSAEPKTTNENCGGVPGSHIPNNTYGSGLLNVWQAFCVQSNRC